MKKLQLISSITLILLFVTFTKCSEDDATPVALSSISGKVTYTNAAGTASNANGAIVMLQDDASGSFTTVADNTGNYSFDNLEAGVYNLSSKYYSANQNVSARLDGLNFAIADVSVTLEATDVSKDLALTSSGQSGTGIEALSAAYSWNGSAYANTGTWTFDNAHSPLIFEFAYRGEEADFSGSFGQTSKFNVTFDPSNLAAASIDVEVDLASVNTRTPGGRDNRTTLADNPTFSPTTMFTELGCIAGTFGITADNAIPSEVEPQPITADADRYAKFSSTNVSKLGDGYVAKGNLVFYGQTKPIDLWFRVVPSWVDTSNSRKYSGFEGKMVFKAKNLFGITNSSINEADIKIYISTVMYKAN